MSVGLRGLMEGLVLLIKGAGREGVEVGTDGAHVGECCVCFEGDKFGRPVLTKT